MDLVYNKRILLFFILLCYQLTSAAQITFGPENIISTNALNARQAIAADIDGDGDNDVLSASNSDDKIAWYENLDGLGTFGPQHIITTLADYAESVYTSDLDGDGDQDVISASSSDYKVAWYENLDGHGTFGSQHILDNLVGNKRSVYAADLDGDGYNDIMAATYSDEILWFRNNGNGTFSSRIVISTAADGANFIFAIDLDNDGDKDIISSSYFDNKIAWYRNDGIGNFSSQIIISNAITNANEVFSMDLDNDGDNDILYSANGIGWIENLGSSSFSSPHVLIAAVTGMSVYAADFDLDGDNDIVSASLSGNKYSIFENYGNGNFSTQQVISTSGSAPQCVFAADINGDGFKDLVCASYSDNKVAWYKTNPTVHTFLNATICNGDSIFLQNHYQTESGIYFDHFVDSTVQTTLFVAPTYLIKIQQNICLNDSFLFNGTYHDTSGIYYSNLTSVYGCDSIYKLELTVNPLPNNFIISGLNVVTVGQTEIYYTPNNSLINYTWQIVNGTLIYQISDNAVQVQWNTSGTGYLYVVSETPFGCTSDTAILEINIGTSDLNEVYNNNNITLFPNPAHKNLTITNNSSKDTQISIFDIRGNLITEN